MKKEIDTKTLLDFTFYIDYNSEVEKLLKEQGYERRNGTCTYEHYYIAVRPLKKWYWLSFHKAKPYVTTEQLPPVVNHKLLVS